MLQFLIKDNLRIADNYDLYLLFKFEYKYL